MPVIIAPSILSADHARMGEEIRAVEAAGADWIHVDVMDGHFVPNLTWGPPVIKSLRATTRKPFDVHLMIEAPERSIEQYVAAGADIVTVHAEACVHLNRTLTHIRTLGARPGVAINPATPVSAVEHVLDLVDLVLVMSVNPGFGGQRFIPQVLPKATALRRMLAGQGLHAHIEIDGGIDPTTAASAIHAGVDVLVAGSAVFGARVYREAIDAIRAAR